MDNMQIYNAGRAVPPGAVKKITGGSYGKAGLSDINPQWRIEKMTELFGPCGIGWTWNPEEYRLEEGVCFAHVTVRYLDTETGAFSEPVHGFGGTPMGKMTDDSDVLKSTFTDAVSNALRYIGIGADVWYKPGREASSNQFDTKYSAPPSKPVQANLAMATAEQLAQIIHLFTTERIEAMLKVYKLRELSELTEAQARMILAKRKKEIEKEEQERRAQDEAAYVESLNGG